jgi:rubredoxin
MSVLIKNMEIPEHCGYCRFRYDGICHALQKTQYSVKECPLVSVNDIKTVQPETSTQPCEPCEVCKWLYNGETLYAFSDCDGGIGFDYIRGIKYCPVCGRRLTDG